MLTVKGEGIWRVDGGSKITFTKEDEFIGTPTPVYYVVEDNLGNYSNIAKIEIEGDCLCKPYETDASDSVPIDGVLILILLLANPLILLLLKRRRFN